MPYRLIVRGIVQGVGFRPFIHRLAEDMELNGYVRNLGDRVEIIVDADKKRLREFIRRIEEEAPPLARITEINVEKHPGPVPAGFEIKESGSTEELEPQMPPDAPVCEDCLREMFDPDDRRYLYPFTGCTNCGPRFTIIEGFPYDRENTTMADFPLCDACRREYEDPRDRRYHAQVVCCPECGPSYRLEDTEGNVLDDDCLGAIEKACKAILEGAKVAIKGIGGFHIACLADEDEIVLDLRKRLGRPQQPFAVMAPDLNTVERFAVLDETAERVLTGRERPIVILPKRDPFPLSEYVAPGLHTVGVMLPYAGIHHVIFREFLGDEVLIMTSANPPGVPMAIRTRDARKILKGIVDLVLTHDRRIAARCDDSVVRVLNGTVRPLRRSRGYVPVPVEVPFVPKDVVIVALGPELDVTACILKGGKAYISQHIGNVRKTPTLDFLLETVERFLRLMNMDWDDVDVIAHDMHPTFASTVLARRLEEEHGVERIPVQHHHAHALALLAEHGVDPDKEQVPVITADGYGYGTDGNAWGGEILLPDGEGGFDRLAHLDPIPMPGGDEATRRPIRMTAAYLYEAGWSEDEIREYLTEIVSEDPDALKHGEREIEAILAGIKRPTVLTTSAGRFLDAVSAALGVCRVRTYEGEPAMKLEAVAAGEKWGEPMPLPEVVEAAVTEGDPRVATAAHTSLAEELHGAVEDSIESPDAVGVTGGVYNNELITADARTRFGSSLLEHREVPAGDGGVSLGQAVAAALYLRR